MNFSKTLHFTFIFLCVGMCLPSVSQSDTSDQEQNSALEVNVQKNDDVYVSQYIKEEVVDYTLKPRFEANWRYSNDRSILMGEFWLPLMQCEEESVLFCDIRLMGDDNENKEFNVGVGYREVLHDTILGDGVAGAMLWFDRRFTDRDFQFNQVTVGGEWLGEQYDLRMNGYFPIDKKKSYLQANPIGTGAGFVGHQILVNTEQVVVEEVLPGIDFEVGSQLNFMNGITDSTRFFVGGYHFEADIAEDITGVRTRIVSDITSDVQVGARFQHDDVRGSQTYVESTIRFPFGHKKKYKHQGIWSRLDESPERDIDVVSNEEVTVNGTNEPLLNATTGLEQNVIHVNNTAAVGGDGSIENPYNTLAVAEVAATSNDLIYVHAGDNATTNQNVGITLDDTGQMLAGSGTDLLYSTERFKSPNGNNIAGALVPATTAPMITNGAGNGVDITADNVFVSGVTVDGATSHGIYALNADNVIIDNVRSDNNTSSGIRVDANGSALNQVILKNNILDNNGSRGIYAFAGFNGTIDQVGFSNNTSKNNANTGIYLQVSGVGSAVTEASFTDNTTTNNVNSGVYANAQSSGNIGTVHFMNNTSDSNNNYGFQAFVQSDGDIGTLNFLRNTATNSTAHGFRAEASGVGSTVTAINFTNNVADTNVLRGLYISSASDGNIGSLNYVGNTVINNGDSGIYTSAQTDGNIGVLNFTNNIATSNTNNGLYAVAQSAGDIGTITLTENTSKNNTTNGFNLVATGAGSTITTAHFLSNLSDANGSDGFEVYVPMDGDIGTVNFTSNTATNNSQGIYVILQTDGDIGTFNVTSNIVTNNTLDGIELWSSGVGSVITTANLMSNVSNNNGNNGYRSFAQVSGNIVTTNFINNTADDNSFHGFYAYAFAGGDLGTVNVTGNTASNNSNSGIRLQASNAGSTITTANVASNMSSSNMIGFHVYTSSDGDIGQVSLEENTSINNSLYGIIINDDSAAGSIGADLGGGAFGSAGNNRVYDNTGVELFVDLDGGNLVAENNWWGGASGLAGGELTLEDASTADTTPFLTSDPE